MVDVFKMAAPKGIRIKVYDVDQAVKAQQNGDFDKGASLSSSRMLRSLRRQMPA